VKKQFLGKEKFLFHLLGHNEDCVLKQISGGPAKEQNRTTVVLAGMYLEAYKRLMGSAKT
jgi:hypothetical protein